MPVKSFAFAVVQDVKFRKTAAYKFKLSKFQELLKFVYIQHIGWGLPDTLVN